MSQYRMLQPLVTVAIPDFKIRSRTHPFDEYIHWHGLKVQKEPNDYNRYCLAKALLYDMQLDKAERVLNECKQGDVVTKFMQAYVHLWRGNMRAGLPLREFRLQAARYPLHSLCPQWDGKPTEQKLLVWQEGGYGDVIQYIRYMPEVLKLCPNATVLVEKSLHPLIKTVCPDSVLAFNPYEFELQCSLMSLPHLLGHYVSSWNTAYIRVPEEKIEQWSMYRGLTGFNYAGNPLHSSDALRSLTPEEAGYWILKNPNWVLLTPEVTGAQDWLDTAGIIANLERLVTVDTGIAHLAGAIGKEALVMINKHHDWRFEVPWYNSWNLFQCKEHSDWMPVFKQVESWL